LILKGFGALHSFTGKKRKKSSGLAALARDRVKGVHMASPVDEGFGPLLFYLPVCADGG
jgi:hypothetical protein